MCNLFQMHTRCHLLFTGFWGLKVHSDPWSNVEDGETEEGGASLIFPLTQKAETRTKRKRSEEVSEIRKMRASKSLFLPFSLKITLRAGNG